MRGKRHLQLLVFAAALICLPGLGGVWILYAAHPLPDSQLIAETGSVQRGRQVFVVSHCASCHASAGQSDRLRLGGGLALASNFGTFRVPNISPDPEAGIGRWRARDLANALLRGVSPAGTHYYPVLPYTSYTHMTPGDVSDLMAYLRTLPAVASRPPPHELAFPFNIRRLVGLWKWLYFKPGPLTPDTGHSELWRRGRYLVEAQSHCAECHSARNVFGAIRSSSRYGGGRDPEGVGFVPNITAAGIGRWSAAQWIHFFATGTTPDLRIVGSTMADVLTDTSMLSQGDQQAMAAYLMSLAPRETSSP